MKGDPERCFKELREIESANDGRVTNEMIVRKARPVSSALHADLTWDEHEAAHKCRLLEARLLKKEIRVVYEGEEDRGPTYYFVSFQEIEENGQRGQGVGFSIEHACADPRLREKMLKDALAGIYEWRQRYRELNELSDIFKTIDRHDR